MVIGISVLLSDWLHITPLFYPTHPQVQWHLVLGYLKTDKLIPGHFSYLQFCSSRIRIHRCSTRIHSRIQFYILYLHTVAMSMTIEEAGVARQGFPKPFPNTPNNVLEQFKMKGKVTVVNGASDGIGLAVATAMAEAGGDVALWYNSNDAAIARAEEIAKEFGVRAKAYQVAVEDAEVVEKIMDQVANDFGKIDVFVANAGMAISKPILETSLSEYDKQMGVNGKFVRSRCLKLVSNLTSKRRRLLRKVRRPPLQATGFW